MGLLINNSNVDLAQRYERMVADTPILAIIEEWAFPTYTRDSRPNSDFSLPGSILLRRTAREVLKEIDHYTEAYLYYLSSTYLPLALAKDPTFGLKIAELGDALVKRADSCGDTIVRNSCIQLAQEIKDNT